MFLVNVTLSSRVNHIICGCLCNSSILLLQLVSKPVFSIQSLCQRVNSSDDGFLTHESFLMQFMTSDKFCYADEEEPQAWSRRVHV